MSSLLSFWPSTYPFLFPLLCSTSLASPLVSWGIRGIIASAWCCSLFLHRGALSISPFRIWDLDKVPVSLWHLYSPLLQTTYPLVEGRMEWGEKEKINEWGIKWKPLSLPSFLPLDISDAHRKLSLPFCLFMMDGAFMPHLDSFQFKSCVNLMISACVKQAMGSGLDLSSSARIFLGRHVSFFFCYWASLIFLSDVTSAGFTG